MMAGISLGMNGESKAANACHLIAGQRILPFVAGRIKAATLIAPEMDLPRHQGGCLKGKRPECVVQSQITIAEYIAPVKPRSP